MSGLPDRGLLVLLQQGDAKSLEQLFCLKRETTKN